MNKAIDLLEKALNEASRVEVLGVWDRERLDRAVSHVKEALAGIKNSGKEEKA
jgi:hypothetical protein